MYCSQCGAQINGAAKFCQNCGAPVSAPSAAPPRRIVYQEELMSAPKQKNGFFQSRWFALLAIALGIFAMILCGYISNLNATPEQRLERAVDNLRSVINVSDYEDGRIRQIEDTIYVEVWSSSADKAQAIASFGSGSKSAKWQDTRDDAVKFRKRCQDCMDDAGLSKYQVTVLVLLAENRDTVLLGVDSSGIVWDNVELNEAIND